MLFLGHCLTKCSSFYCITDEEFSRDRVWCAAGSEREPFRSSYNDIEHPFSEEFVNSLAIHLDEEFNDVRLVLSWEISDETAILAVCTQYVTAYYQYDRY